MRRFLFVIILLGTMDVSAKSVNMRIHNQYLNPRAMGMGNAFIANAQDYTTLFYNPAGLARLPEWQMNFAPNITLGSDIFNLQSDIEKYSDNDDSQAMAELLDKFYGTNHYFRTSLEAVWVWPKWGMGFIPLDLTMDYTFHNQIGPVVDATIITDTTAVLGYGKDYPWFADARFSLGVTGKLIHRIEMRNTFSAIDLVDDPDIYQKDLINEGLAIDADIGLLYTPDLPSEGLLSLIRYARPTFGMVLRNALESGFKSNLHTVSDESGEPEKLYRVVDIGTRWEYPSFWVFSSRGMMDFRNIGDPKLTNPLKALHIGWELNWKMYSWWKGGYRIGLNQGYWTAGFSARMAWFNLDLNTWGEEVGTTDMRKESRVYMIKMNIEI